MSRDIDSRDVLDPDALTRRVFRGCIMGYYRPTGPNAWDPYRYVSQQGGELEVLPGLRVQVERFGAMVRLRKDGRVVRVAWVPEGLPEDSAPAEVRRHFIDRYLAPFDEAAGQGAAAVIADKLRA